MKTPVNSIEIPRDYIDLCERWYGGMGCNLYAVCSTDGLTTGTRRPPGCDSEEKWYLNIWRGLAADVGIAVCAAKQGCNACDDGGDGAGHDADYTALVQFEDWVDCIVSRLEAEYRLPE
jgi:hypothetical protein